MTQEAGVSALLTDLYELTMAEGYLRSGWAERRAVFSLAFRHNPFRGAYAVACGLSRCLSALEGLAFSEADVTYLARLRGPDGAPLFGPALLDWARGFRVRVDVDAVPEGTLVFAGEPLLRVTGPLAEAQLLEPLCLNFLNFETLIATKAARVCEAARGKPVLEFGLRRAQGTDGALGASRAAYVGGCEATSNALAGRLFDIPVRGTHAHSWVMAMGDEERAFRVYLETRPSDGVLLVDTYDTLGGVERAISAAQALRERGIDLRGVRLDSGDLDALSRAARCRLDEAGLRDVRILASGDLDEYAIERLVSAGAPIDAWGVGTRLATAFDQPALDGVYKLTAIEVEGRFEPRLKLSDSGEKGSLPGIVGARRYADDGEHAFDVLYDELQEVGGAAPREGPFRLRRADGEPFEPGSVPPFSEPLLVPVLRGGRVVYDAPSAESARRRTLEQLSRLAPRYRRLTDPETYPVVFDERLVERRARLQAEIRSGRFDAWNVCP